MAAPRHLLRIIAQYNLDPKKAYTTQHVASNGHITSRLGHPTVEHASAKAEPSEHVVESNEKTKPAGDEPAGASASETAKPKTRATKVKGETASVEQPKEEKSEASDGSEQPADGESA